MAAPCDVHGLPQGCEMQYFYIRADFMQYIPVDLLLICISILLKSLAFTAGGLAWLMTVCSVVPFVSVV